MQLSELLGRIALRLGYRYPSGTPALSNDRKNAIINIINDTCMAIALEAREQFMEFKTNTLSAPYETGTVSVTEGSTTVTGSGTNWTSSYANWWFYGPDGRLYEISSIDSTTQITLTESYVGDTESGASYKLTPLFYALPTDCLKLIDVTYNKDTPLTGVPFKDLQGLISFGTPAYYAVKGTKVRFEPIPDGTIWVSYVYVRKPTTVSADSDVIDVPAEFLPYLEARVWRKVAELWARDELQAAIGNETDEYKKFLMRKGRQREKRSYLRDRFSTDNDLLDARQQPWILGEPKRI